MAITVDKVGLLGTHDFFRDLPAPLLARIAERSRVVAHAAGDVIFAKGDEGDSLLVVIDGMVRISVLSADAREVVLNLIGPGQVFGEIALLDGLQRTAEARADADCRLLVLGRGDFRALLLAEPLIGVRLLEVVGRRLRRTSEQVETLSFKTPTARLAGTLLMLADSQPSRANGGGPEITLTQEAIGQAAGLSRESTNKKLRAWMAEGIIDLRRGHCVILDRPALARLSRDQEG